MVKPPFPRFEPKDEPEPPPQADSVEPPALFPDEAEGAMTRLRDVPFRMLVPNLITLGAICSGLTAVRMAFEARFELAIAAIVFAAILDAVDGRVARILKGSSAFGEQLDSLADFVNFGVAPALVLYLWALNEWKALGWIVALVFAICGCLRLARFNVMLEDENRPEWHVDFFTGVPAPAGALLALLPIYLGFLGVERGGAMVVPTVLYTLLIGFLMVSNLPTWSGKRAGKRVSRRLVLPVMIGIVMGIVFLFGYPWITLSVACIVYLASLPFSWRDHAGREAG